MCTAHLDDDDSAVGSSVAPCRPCMRSGRYDSTRDAVGRGWNEPLGIRLHTIRGCCRRGKVGRHQRGSSIDGVGTWMRGRGWPRSVVTHLSRCIRSRAAAAVRRCHMGPLGRAHDDCVRCKCISLLLSHFPLPPPPLNNTPPRRCMCVGGPRWLCERDFGYWMECTAALHVGIPSGRAGCPCMLFTVKPISTIELFLVMIFRRGDRMM